MANSELDDIIRDNTPRLRSYVKSRVSNCDDADDIVQDTLYHFLRTISIMDNPIAQVTSWLYTVAHNLIINHNKKHRDMEIHQRRDCADDSFMAEMSEIMAVSDNESPEMRMLRNMVWDELDRAMAELPREQREAIEKTDILGLSVKEAAQQMDVSVNTFLSRKHYAIIHIRKRMKSLYDEIREA